MIKMIYLLRIFSGFELLGTEALSEATTSIQFNSIQRAKVEEAFPSSIPCTCHLFDGRHLQSMPIAKAHLRTCWVGLPDTLTFVYMLIINLCNELMNLKLIFIGSIPANDMMIL